ncbi:hypothetical protein J3D48_004438 [Pseudomonas fluorescens]|nr:hypothetical protein [Pseudomonas fluorescens]
MDALQRAGADWKPVVVSAAGPTAAKIGVRAER